MSLKQMEDLYNSTADQRSASQAVRHQYRVLTEDEKAQVSVIKDLGATLIDVLDNIGQSDELVIAKIKVQEAVMWGVRAVTA